jgi:Spy/CpxP family protein refolding chaperone
MNRWKLISGIALLFILGVLVGSIGTKLYFERQHPRLADHRSRKAFLMERLSKELNLTEDQKVTIGKFVEQMEEKRREYFLQKRAETENLVDQMKKELTPDQQKKLDVLREKFEKRQKAREERQFSR